MSEQISFIAFGMGRQLQKHLDCVILQFTQRILMDWYNALCRKKLWEHLVLRTESCEGSCSLFARKTFIYIFVTEKKFVFRLFFFNCTNWKQNDFKFLKKALHFL